LLLICDQRFLCGFRVKKLFQGILLTEKWGKKKGKVERRDTKCSFLSLPHLLHLLHIGVRYLQSILGSPRGKHHNYPERNVQQKAVFSSKAVMLDK